MSNAVLTIPREERGYFNYLVGYVIQKNSRLSFNLLLKHLYTKNFIWTIYLDKNRAADGLAMRSRFFSEDTIDRPCSVLEMMIALSDRMENHILYDPTVGDRTGLWFWTMITSMKLSAMDDRRYDEEKVERQLNIMLHREYTYNGEGGLFTVDHPEHDMRDTEIWYQMQWWVRENYL